MGQRGMLSTSFSAWLTVKEMCYNGYEDAAFVLRFRLERF